MKKWLSLLFCLLMLSSTWAQSRRPAITPPDTVLQTFAAKLPGLKPAKWRQHPQKKIYMALFKDQDIKGMMYITPNGRWLQTKTYLYELPPAIDDAIYRLYDYAEIKRTIQTETEKGKRYKVILDSGKVIALLLMDEQGTVLRKKEKPKKPIDQVSDP
jgi:hypothetical protein